MNDEQNDPAQPYPGESPRIFQSIWWVGGYVAPIIVILFTLLWSFTIYWLIGWRSRDWQYGTVPYVPGQSLFTSETRPPGAPPRQVELPVKPRGGTNARR